MKARKAIALILLAAAVSCDGDRGGGGIPATVTIAGIQIDVTLFAIERDRRNATFTIAPLAATRGALLAWPRARFIKLESEFARASFDVAFLDATGNILDVQALVQGDPEGITSQVEAVYALLLAPGRPAQLGAAVGTGATLSDSIRTASPGELPIVRIGPHTAYAELALTDSERQHGLMFRPRMSADDGMLFVYPFEASKSFWMGNTLIPLDIAFFRSDGTLINVVEMPIYPDPRNPPANPPLASSTGPALYILEMNLGWFRARGLIDGAGAVIPGTRADFPPEALNGSF